MAPSKSIAAEVVVTNVLVYILIGKEYTMNLTNTNFYAPSTSFRI